MRNLTLGLLIIAGGILASLPFRRTAPIDESVPRTQPLDPTSVSTPSSVGMLVNDRVPKSEWIDRIVPQSTNDLPEWPPRRELSPPLTYDELAVPITRPDRIEQRFTAAEPIRQNVAGKVIETPAMKSVAPRRELHREPERMHPTIDGARSVLVPETNQDTTLASTPLGESRIEQLPKRDDSKRERFWIRQP